MTRVVRRSAGARDPYGIGPGPGRIGPIAPSSGSVLAVYDQPVQLRTALRGWWRRQRGRWASPAARPYRLASVECVIIVPEGGAFLGRIVYAKAGNVWVQTDQGATQLTDGGARRCPRGRPRQLGHLHPDSRGQIGKWPLRGVATVVRHSDFKELMRIRADGTGEPQRLLSGRVRQCSLRWSAWMRQPVLSPDGNTIALVTMRPQPDDSNVVLQFYDIKRKRLTRAGVARSRRARPSGPGVAGRREVPALHHERPQRGPGRAAIMRYDPKAKKDAGR